MGDRFMMSPDRARGQRFPPLARQSSLYNLTFDEVQSQLGNIGKPLNAMNLDELLKSVIAVEGQLVQNPSSSSSSASFFLGNFNLNGTLRKKTVDEVWKEIVDHGNVNAMDNQFVQQQLTLGETTLEDFLVRAGVINTASQNGVLDPQQFMAIDPVAVVSQQADWLQFQMATVQQQQQQQMTMMDSNFNVPDSSVYEGQVVDVGYPKNQLAMTMLPAMSATSQDSQATTARKRRCSDVMEKTIERRQKRMIKNRESAARSRARKQAYTNQLEVEVDQLRKMNSWLKRQKEVNMLLSSNTIAQPKYQLRRTSSASF
ncbi:Basic-leucine zipper domain - like 10 [Theobroma cacao]|nr:Basic-leucine zipper domain - like 10 [Theobroma cacao]